VTTHQFEGDPRLHAHTGGRHQHHALHQQGWTISAIARHTGRDRKTVRAYLTRTRSPGVRERPDGDPFDRFVDYLTARLAEDPHLWALTLFDELQPLGFTGSYPTLTRQIRTRGLRPRCLACGGATGRANAVIDHPPGEETQWDWLELPDPPVSWGWSKACVLVGSLAHSGRWRGVLAPTMDQAHLVDGLHRILAGLGGVTRSWRFDRMATVCHPDSGKVTASFAGVAKHYGVTVSICPPRSGIAKGWWRRSTILRRNAGGAPWLMTWPSNKPKPLSTSSLRCGVTPGSDRP